MFILYFLYVCILKYLLYSVTCLTLIRGTLRTVYKEVLNSLRAAEYRKCYPSYKQTYCYYQTTAAHLIQILTEDSFTADPAGKFLSDVCLKIKKTMKIKILS